MLTPEQVRNAIRRGRQREEDIKRQGGKDLWEE